MVAIKRVFEAAVAARWGGVLFVLTRTAGVTWQRLHSAAGAAGQRPLRPFGFAQTNLSLRPLLARAGAGAR